MNFVEPAIRKIFGEKIRLKCEAASKNSPAQNAQAAQQKDDEILDEAGDTPVIDEEPPITKANDVFEVAPETHPANVSSDPVIKKVTDMFHGKIVNK